MTDTHPMGGNGGIPSDFATSPVFGQRRLKAQTESDAALRTYASLSQPRVLVTNITQDEIATIEGARFSFAKSFDNVDVATPLYILIENPADSGINTAFTKRILKAYVSGVISYQVFWDYDVTGLTKTPIPAFNENNLFRGVNPSRIEISVLNPVTAPTKGDWVLNGAVTPVSEGIEREVDFIPTTGVGTNTSGGVSPDAGFRLYGQGTGALIKVVPSANDNRLIVGYSWVEAPITL